MPKAKQIVRLIEVSDQDDVALYGRRGLFRCCAVRRGTASFGASTLVETKRRFFGAAVSIWRNVIG